MSAFFTQALDTLSLAIAHYIYHIICIHKLIVCVPSCTQALDTLSLAIAHYIYII